MLTFFDCRCKKCNRFLARIFQAGIVQLAPCPSCKEKNIYKFIDNDLIELKDVDLTVIEKHVSDKKI